MGKIKKEVEEETEPDVTLNDSSVTKQSYEEKIQYLNIISQPLAGRRLTKKLYKLVKKASKTKGNVLNGLKAVQKGIRKGEKGLVIIAGDVTPVEMMIHIPGVCEEKTLTYIFIPSRQDLGAALGHRTPSVVVLLKDGTDYSDSFSECKAECEAVPSIYPF